MVDFIEVNSIKTFSVIFLDPVTAAPIAPTSPIIEIGFFDNMSFNLIFSDSLNMRPGVLGEYFKEVFLDPNLYTPNQFYYVRFRGTHPVTALGLLQEDSFRALSNSFQEGERTNAFIFQTAEVKQISPEFSLSVNSEINSKRAFLRGDLLGQCDLWVEILDFELSAPTDVAEISFDIEDLTDCLGICNSECGGSVVVENLAPIHFGTGKYYAEWSVLGDANPGPWMIHWDIKFTPTSQWTRISQGFHVVAKKNMYDLNFQDVFSPTADN